MTGLGVFLWGSPSETNILVAVVNCVGGTVGQGLLYTHWKMVSTQAENGLVASGCRGNLM